MRKIFVTFKRVRFLGSLLHPYDRARVSKKLEKFHQIPGPKRIIVNLLTNDNQGKSWKSSRAEYNVIQDK